MRRRVLLATILSCAIGVSVPASATFSGDNGRILYGRLDADFDFVVRSVLSDGTGGTRMDLPSSTWDAGWSADGGTIVYSQGFQQRARISIFDTTTGDRTPVLDADDFDEPLYLIRSVALRPTGDELVFCAEFRRDERLHLFTVGTDGSYLSMISGDRSLCFADWSSTGRIAAATEGRKVRVFTLDPDGSDVELVTQLPPPTSTDRIILVQPSWSPDGQSLTFAAQAGRLRSDIWLIDADGTDLRRFTDSRSGWEHSPRFAPDGGSIVFHRDGGGPFGSGDLWIKALSGGRTRLTDTPQLDEFAFSWQAV